MRRKVLEGQHVTGGQCDDRFRIAGRGKFAESAQHRDEIFHGAVVIDDEDQRPLDGAAQKHEQQRFRSGREPGDTNPPRALFQMGGYTQEAGKRFYVREEFADEGKKHALSILSGAVK